VLPLCPAPSWTRVYSESCTPESQQWWTCSLGGGRAGAREQVRVSSRIGISDAWPRACPVSCTLDLSIGGAAEYRRGGGRGGGFGGGGSRGRSVSQQGSIAWPVACPKSVTLDFSYGLLAVHRAGVVNESLHKPCKCAEPGGLRWTQPCPLLASALH
jgi:hypothetical protein